MAIKIINKKLHTDVFKKIDYYDKMASKSYNRGDMKMGKKWESKSNKIYKDNYTKMFNVKKTKKGYVLTS